MHSRRFDRLRDKPDRADWRGRFARRDSGRSCRRRLRCARVMREVVGPKGRI
jgi:hypothetical protein